MTTYAHMLRGCDHGSASASLRPAADWNCCIVDWQCVPHSVDGLSSEPMLRVLFLSYFNDIELASSLFYDSSRATNTITHTLSHGQRSHSMHTRYEQSHSRTRGHPDSAYTVPHQHADLPQAPSSHGTRTHDAGIRKLGGQHACIHPQHNGRCIVLERSSADMLTTASRHARLLQNVVAPNKGRSLRITNGTSLASEEYRLNSEDRLLDSDEAPRRASTAVS